MARRYDETAQVQRGLVDEQEAPARIIWRGRLYVVRAVLGHWVQTAPWWRPSALQGVYGTDAANPSDAQGTEDRPVAVLDVGQREVWRVEVRAGRIAPRVVLDLALDRSTGDWWVLRSHD